MTVSYLVRNSLSSKFAKINSLDKLDALIVEWTSSMIFSAGSFIEVYREEIVDGVSTKQFLKLYSYKYIEGRYQWVQYLISQLDPFYIVRRYPISYYPVLFEVEVGHRYLKSDASGDLFYLDSKSDRRSLKSWEVSEVGSVAIQNLNGVEKVFCKEASMLDSVFDLWWKSRLKQLGEVEGHIKKLIQSLEENYLNAVPLFNDFLKLFNKFKKSTYHENASILQFQMKLSEKNSLIYFSFEPLVQESSHGGPLGETWLGVVEQIRPNSRRIQKDNIMVMPQFYKEGYSTEESSDYSTTLQFNCYLRRETFNGNFTKSAIANVLSKETLRFLYTALEKIQFEKSCFEQEFSYGYVEFL